MRTRDGIQPLQFTFPPFSHFPLCRVSSPLAFAKSCCTKGFCNVAFRSFFPNKEVWHQLGQVSTRNWARSSNIPLMSVLGPLKSRDEKIACRGVRQIFMQFICLYDTWVIWYAKVKCHSPPPLLSFSTGLIKVVQKLSRHIHKETVTDCEV